MARSISLMGTPFRRGAVLLLGTALAAFPALAVAEGADDKAALDPAAARQLGANLAREARQARRGMTYEEFRDTVVYLPQTGKFYVNGDTPIRNEKLLREFWEQNIRSEPDSPGGEETEFAVGQVGGLDQVWNGTDRRALSYCVSNAFGARHAEVVQAMADATGAWEVSADIDFFHVPGQDGACDASNRDVLFDVVPKNMQGTFFAVAFKPNDPRPARSIVIDPSAFTAGQHPSLAGFTLTGVLRHELGHVLGGRHEHTRPEAGKCFEDSEWRPITDYDSVSVMHYPHCNGDNDWTLAMSEGDRHGVACLYGPAPGFVIDPALIVDPDSCAGGPPAPAPSVVTIGPEDIARGEFRILGLFPVAEESHVRVAMTGTGDADLYVKVEGPPLIANYDCRPFSEGSEESCDFELPAGAGTVGVGVNGYSAARYEVTLTFTARDPG